MPATYTAHHLQALAARVMVDYDIDDALNVVDLRPGVSGKLFPLSDGYRRFMAGLFRSVGTGSVTKFQIIVAEDADGATNPTIVCEHAIGSAPNAVGDTIWLECDIEQCKEVLATAAYVGVRVHLVTATDECVIYFERADPTFKFGGLTADYIS